ncbi:MAG: hypothetical protein ACFFB5_01985 [Promethearchaeota archaeon]
MRTPQNCCKCNKSFYASYKGKYYCPMHLKERLAKEKKTIPNEGTNED